MSKNLKLAWCVYFVAVVIFAIFAYGLTVPNLILNSSPLFWRFQTFMWQTFYNQRLVLAEVYSTLVLIFFGVYFWIVRQSLYHAQTLSLPLWKKWLPWLVVLLVPLWLGYNALSADIFNYIFSARIIVLYHGNPYLQMPLDFPSDTWTRFMHNVNSLSLYGYAWTGWSVLLYVLGAGKFLITWLMFKGSATLSLVVLSAVYALQFDKDESAQIPFWTFLVVILNPLVLLEYGLTAHNDVWMMLWAVLSFRLISRVKGRPSTLAILGSVMALGLSIGVKFATELLLPLWLLIMLVTFLPHFKFRNLVMTWWPVAAATLMFLPLLTSRSLYFNPWYLGWSLVWIPMFPWQLKSKSLREIPIFITTLLVVFSITSLARYLPWLVTGGYGTVVLQQQDLITWSAVPITAVGYVLYQVAARFKTHSN